LICENFTTEINEAQGRKRCEAAHPNGEPWWTLPLEEREDWIGFVQQDSAPPDFGGNEEAKNQFDLAVDQLCCDHVLATKRRNAFTAPVMRVRRAVRVARRNRAYRSRRRNSTTAFSGGEPDSGDSDSSEPPKSQQFQYLFVLNSKKYSNTNYFYFGVRLNTWRMVFRPRSLERGRAA
jgi:hypothetical protein